ncbi:MAG: hypothetical protein HUU35_01760, partial [Armatimonadetes bacterium]|nr:hypothetical protein [Armatimonadota bacterium]
AWLTRRPQINDLGFLCAWLAAALVLFDAAQNGRDELYPYVSLDLYAVPVGLYLLAMVEQRSSESEQVRRTAVLMILGSLLVSAFAATSPVHDAVLFVAVMATVLYGIERGDVLVRYAGVATFAVWVLVQVWRLRSGIGQGLLIALLLALGAGAIAAGLRQEGRSRRAEDEPSD